MLEASEEAADAFVERVFAKGDEYLHDTYATIGDAARFHTKLAGVSFEGRQDVIAGLHAGAPLELEIAHEDGRRETVRLGSDLSSGERPQAIVPAQAWQAAQSLGDWTLCGCTVAPGFEFARFELAPKNWEPE